MNLFDAKTIRDYIQARLKSLPGNGRGELKKLAEAVDVHSSTLSQILRDDRQFSLEQAAKACEYFGFNEIETSYFIALVEYERAGTEKLRSIFARELKRLRTQSDEISTVVPRDSILLEETKAQFYANWHYIGLAVLCSLRNLQTVDALAQRTGLNKKTVNQVLRFLSEKGILREHEGQFSPGTRSTHLESTSPLVSRHHGNWRVKAMEKHPSLSVEELAYTCPMSLSEKDAKLVRKILLSSISEIGKIRDPSPSEQAYCLNIDWFRF